MHLSLGLYLYYTLLFQIAYAPAHHYVPTSLRRSKSADVRLAIVKAQCDPVCTQPKKYYPSALVHSPL